MIDVKTQLVSTLSAATSLSIYYENFSKPVTLPCITYREIRNDDRLVGTSISYSDLKFEVRIYSKLMSEVVAKQAAIDTALKAIGYRRTYSYESSDETVIIKILHYSAISREEV